MSVYILYPTKNFEAKRPRVNFIVRSFVRSFASVVRSSFVRRDLSVDAQVFSTSRSFSEKKSLGRRDRFRPKIVEIAAILAIFEQFEILKIHIPLFGEFRRSSRDLYRNP